MRKHKGGGASRCMVHQPTPAACSQRWCRVDSHCTQRSTFSKPTGTGSLGWRAMRNAGCLSAPALHAVRPSCGPPRTCRQQLAGPRHCQHTRQRLPPLYVQPLPTAAAAPEGDAPSSARALSPPATAAAAAPGSDGLDVDGRQGGVGLVGGRQQGRQDQNRVAPAVAATMHVQHVRRVNRVQFARRVNRELGVQFENSGLPKELPPVPRHPHPRTSHPFPLFRTVAPLLWRCGSAAGCWAPAAAPLSPPPTRPPNTTSLQVHHTTPHTRTHVAV